MGGNEINYPDQPSYGEGLADALKAQLGAGTGLQIGEDASFVDLAKQLRAQGLLGDDQFLGEGLAEIDRRIRLAYAGTDPEVTERTLLGEVTRADEQGRFVEGQQFLSARGDVIEGAQQVSSEEDRGRLLFENTKLKDLWEGTISPAPGDKVTGAKIQELKAAVDKGTMTDAEARAAFGRWELTSPEIKDPEILAARRNVASVGSYIDPNNALGGTLTQEDVYGTAKPGSVVAREGGLVDLYGGDTKVRRYDPETGEASYGELGFTDEGEFQGLLPMQAQGEAYLSTLQREADVADVELLGGRATEAIRSQGQISGILDQLGAQRQSGQAATQDLRTGLLGEASSALGQGLSQRELRDIEQYARSAGVASGRLRDVGRITGEARALAEGDRQRRMQNLGVAQSILGGEMGMQGQQFGQTLQHLGAEQATAADPMMAILGRPSSTAPGAQAMLSSGAAMQQGAGPQFLNPEAGLGYIQNQATNAANLEIARLGANAQRDAGVASAVGQGIGTFAALCWVAREVYGVHNPKWMQFREWLTTKAPRWLLNVYATHGERFAEWISDKPKVKNVIRWMMDKQIA